jgi:hypothetical protein
MEGFCFAAKTIVFCEAIWFFTSQAHFSYKFNISQQTDREMLRFSEQRTVRRQFEKKIFKGECNK